MPDYPLPPGAELIGGSIRMQSCPDAGDSVRRLAGRLFNSAEAQAVTRFLAGEATLAATVSEHLQRFADGGMERLVIRMWMRSRFGEVIGEAVDEHLGQLEREEDDWSVVFVGLYNKLDELRRSEIQLDVRRPPRVDRTRVTVTESGGGRVYTADTRAVDAPTKFAAVPDRDDAHLKCQVRHFSRMPGMPDVRSVAPIAVQFLLGGYSLEDTLQRLRRIPMTDPEGKRMSGEVKELIIISNSMALWLAVAFDLNLCVVLRYVRHWLTQSKRTNSDAFHGLLGKFGRIADIEAEYGLHHATVNQLIQYALEDRVPPTGKAALEFERIDWRRFNEEAVPENQRDEIVDKVEDTLHDNAR